MDNNSSSMSQMNKQDNSVMNKVKGLVVRAWRERWNDVQWGIQLKRAIHSAAPGYDSRELVEMLLKQALVGAHPNTLILSYIKQATFSKMLPVTATLKFISNYEEFAKPHCLLTLVDLAKEFTVNMGFCYGSEGGLSLCQSLQSLVHWLLKVMLLSVQQYQEQQTPDQENILHAAALALQAMTQSDTVNALLYIARSQKTEIFVEMEQTELNVRGTLSQISQEVIPSALREDVSNMAILKNVKSMVQAPEALLDVSHIPICPSIVTVVALEATLNPTSDMQPFVDQLLIMENLMKLQRSNLFCELLRGCFLGLVNTNVGECTDQYSWCAFTYLKVPQTLQKIQQQSPSRDFSADLEAGFDKLIMSNSLLDMADTKHNCDLLDFLLEECKKSKFLSDAQRQKLAQKRKRETQRVVDGEQLSNPGCPYRMIHAEVTVNNILKNLEADCSKGPDTMSQCFNVIKHLLTSGNFDLLLAAAAATGKLHTLCFRLIKHNEFATNGTMGENSKSSQTRGLLFDLTFLMLCHITQTYGSEMFTSSPECIKTFFVQWVMRCLPEDGKYKSVDISMPVDSSKVDFLLNAFTTGSEISSGNPKWHEICINTPYAIQEMLFAWEHGSLASENIKLILNYVKSRMLSLPVVVVAWMCSYINMLSDDARAKPLSMLQQLIQPPTGDSTVTLYYTERAHLMQTIVQKMIQEILPPSQRRPSTQHVPATSLPSDVMTTTMTSMFTKGWLDMETLRTFEALLNLCGSDWFSDRLIKHMLHSYRIEDMTLNLSLVFALTHMDLEHLTLSLLLHSLPNLLLSADKQTLLLGPRGYTLAKYCVLACCAAQTAKSAYKDTRRGRKRSRKEFDIDDLEELDSRQVPLKRMKMEPEITLDTEAFNFDFLNVKDDGEAPPVIDTKDPLNKALVNLFRLFNAIVHDEEITPKTSFIISFIDEAVKCGPNSRYILQFMPPNMLSQMLKSIPGVFDNHKVLQICDLSNNTGRKVATKAICQNARNEKD